MDLLKFKLQAERKQRVYQEKRYAYTELCLRDFRETQALLKTQRAETEKQQHDRHDGESKQDAIEHSQTHPPVPAE